MNSPRLAVPFLMVVLAAILPGCAGTVIVEFAVDAQVATRKPSGAVQPATPGQFALVPKPAGSLIAFDSVKYRGETLEWSVGTGTLGLGGGIGNLSPARLCLGFDRARIASNLHPQEVPLRISSWHRIEAGQLTRLGSTRPGSPYFEPPELCLDPGQRVTVSMSPDLQQLFPSRKMFNVRWPEGEPRLVDTGIGNWFRLVVPLATTGGEETLEITLTARDSRARISHY